MTAREKVLRAIEKFEASDKYLLEKNLSERCIAARLALYMQQDFADDYKVDVEYNRHGMAVKRLLLDERYRDSEDENGNSIAVPDIIVHKRGEDGPNLLILELKKTTTNTKNRGLRDKARVEAFIEQIGYEQGGLIECQTRSGQDPSITIVNWMGAEGD